MERNKGDKPIEVEDLFDAKEQASKLAHDVSVKVHNWLLRSSNIAYRRGRAEGILWARKQLAESLPPDAPWGKLLLKMFSEEANR